MSFCALSFFMYVTLFKINIHTMNFNLKKRKKKIIRFHDPFLDSMIDSKVGFRGQTFWGGITKSSITNIKLKPAKAGLSEDPALNLNLFISLIFLCGTRTADCPALV
uniref:Uncharacterized protein n=1 Tax=Cacopsylla melanoneura TaxID=428564 RepID=A0A8D8VAM3_9HEMI